MRYLPCQLTKVPALQIDTANWGYPDMMRSAGMSGRARIAFVVDTAGRYVAGSVRELSNSHPLFSSYTKYQLTRARFSPGRRGRELVPVELVHDFVYVVPEGVNVRELPGIPLRFTLASARSSESIPMLEIRIAAEDTVLGPPPDPAVRDSLAHEAIRVGARALGWKDDSLPPSSRPPALVICVQGDTGVFESGADRALARAMNRPHVRVMTLRGCPPTRSSMVALPPELTPRYPPDSVPFVEPHRLRVVRAALRRSGGPQVDIVDEHQLGELWSRCVQMPRATSKFALRCWIHTSVVH